MTHLMMQFEKLATYYPWQHKGNNMEVTLEDFKKLCSESKDMDDLIEKVKKLEEKGAKFSKEIKIP